MFGGFVVLTQTSYMVGGRSQIYQTTYPRTINSRIFLCSNCQVVLSIR